jgi:hypothetical protein
VKERLLSWLRNTNKALERRWWWLLVLFIADKVWELFEHRIYGYINAAIDAHSAEYLQRAKPHILYVVTNPIWVSIVILVLIIGGICLHAYLDTLNKTLEDTKPLESELATKVSSVPIAIGLTFDFAEVEILPDSSPSAYKFKLRVYWTNYSGETIHLAVPVWKEGIAPQGGHLTYSYQLRQPNNQQQPWGDELKEVDVSAGRRCRMWLGLDPARREDALKLLDTGGLGLLIIPVSTPNYSVNVCIRPDDRGLRQLGAREYDEQKKCVAKRFMGMDHGSKEAIRFLSFGRIMSAQRVTDHLRQCNFPNADKVFDGLRDDIVPLVARYGNDEYRINPALEKIVKEVVAADKKEFIETASRLPADQFAYKAKNESGFEARYNAIAPKD